MLSPLPIRIFLASPGDLDRERQAVKECVRRYNLEETPRSGIKYEILDWEQVRGTAKRPQAAINELIHESHFLISLFKHKWGSPSGGEWGYSSGTEEELFTALVDLAQPESFMKDVWLGFFDDENPASEILNLKQQIIDRHAVMFESLSDTQALRQKLNARLITWEEVATASKNAIQIDLTPSSGQEMLKAACLRIKGEKLISLGQEQAGKFDLSTAARLGGPQEKLAYARFLERSGDFPGANTFIVDAINELNSQNSSLYSPAAAEAFARQADVLRRQGHIADALGRLHQALTLVTAETPASREIRCQILDKIGLAYHRSNELSDARKHFEESLTIRTQLCRPTEIAQSRINLARLEVGCGNLKEAERQAVKALEALSPNSATSLRANAEILMAQVLRRQENSEAALHHAEMGLAINKQVSNKIGEAIALNLLAQCSYDIGKYLNSKDYANKCLEINREINNPDGVKRAEWILSDIKRLSGQNALR